MEGVARLFGGIACDYDVSYLDEHGPDRTQNASETLSAPSPTNFFLRTQHYQLADHYTED